MPAAIGVLFGADHPLAANATVQVVTMSKLWRVSDGTNAYFIQVEGPSGSQKYDCTSMMGLAPSVLR